MIRTNRPGKEEATMDAATETSTRRGPGRPRLSAADAAERRASDRQKFVRLVNKRVPVALEKLRLVGNLTNKSNYNYTEEDAEAILDALKDAIADIEERFSGKSGPDSEFRLE